jgi:hypothetical protein
MALSISREFLLVAACAVWPPSDRRTNAIREAAEEPIDWDRVLKVVMRHRVAGLVRDGLTRARIAVPASVTTVIGAQAAALVHQNLALVAEGVKLQRMFAEADLPIAFMKGVSLSMLAYGDLGIRYGRDIDLLVSHKSIMTAIAVLERAGYRMYEPPETFGDAQLGMWLLRCKELRFVQKESGHEVELHVRLFDNPRLMSKAATMSSLRTVRFTETVGLSTFGEDDLFAYLCAHGAIHCWFRLKWLADIGALLAHQPEGGVERLYLAAEARGAGRSAAQAILLSRQILGAQIPDSLIATLRKHASVRWLEAMAMKALTADTEPTEQPFGTTWNNLSLFLLGRGFRYWLAELQDLLISPVDILTLPLPKQLRGLYPVLRLPLWLWRRRTSLGTTRSLFS